jgi:hypothetical protein
MKGLILNFAGLLVCLGCVACASHSARLPIGASHNPSNPEAVAVLDAGTSGTYDTVGKVHSHCRWNWFFAWAACGKKGMVESLRREAAFLGANGLIDVRHTSFSQFEWTDVHYHATAVRFSEHNNDTTIRSH